ncbi:hypothetical protein DFH07DRAFT_785434 [Mycena maculata]|uniref:Uncharacterized protein n=1 Tax=Mycena maculata TaxID=230809 RepID=A0AAD7HAV1_9AGAR|nr:hypothetical protein DFH07DRAFT_785434 [Mycena maculata]
MSSTNPRIGEGCLGPDEASNRRAPPPHMSSTADINNSSFQMAATSQNTSTAHPADIPLPSGRSSETHSSAGRTTSPSSPSGLTASVITAPSGEQYLMESDTHLRVDLQNGIVLTTEEYAELQRRANMETPRTNRDAPSLSPPQHYTSFSRHSLADFRPSRPNTPAQETPASKPASPTLSGANSELAGDLLKLINELVGEIQLTNSPATAAQIDTLHAIRGAFTTSRQHLLATTAATIDQRNATSDTHAALVKIRDETVQKLYDLHVDIGSQHACLDKCLEASLFALRGLGVTEALGDLIKKLAESWEKKTPVPFMAGYSLGHPTDIPVGTQQEIETVVPGRAPDEASADYSRRIHATVERKARAASAFSLKEPTTRDEPSQLFNALFASGLGVSQSGYTTATGNDQGTGLDVFEEFSQEADREIRAVVDRELGEETEVPPRIRPPKMEAPGKFKGQNDHLVFMLWLEAICTWMRAQFFGGPSVSRYRVVLLKTLIEGPMLEWFIDYVETRPGRVSEIKHDFASILCALHRRFMTAATAQQASRDFDAVRYSSDEGPLKLMDSLMSVSRRMREPMTLFMIAQRFLKLLPDKIFDMMVQQRGLSAEYLSLAQLRANAHQIWATDPMTRSASRSHGPQTQTLRRVPVAAARVEAAKRAPVRSDAPRTTHPNHTPVSGAGHTTDKRCFKCGVIGHIGSDPICVKHPNHNPKARVGVAAQRVVDTYDEDEFPDELEGSTAEEDPNWGGSQYDPDINVEEHDPNEAPDLGDLIEFDDTDERPRVGAMRAQYFSFRVVPLEPLDPRELHPVVGPMATLSPIQRELASTFTEDWHLEVMNSREDLYSSSAQLDLQRIEDHRRQTGMEDLTDDERASRLRELVAGHEYRFSGETTFTELAQAYQLRYGERPESRAATEEWNAILLLGNAEHSARVAARIWIARRGNTPYVSVASLGRSSEVLVEQSAHFAEVLSTNHEVRTDAIACADAAQDSIDEIDALPAPQRPSIGLITNRAREMLVVVEEEMSEIIGLINREEPRLEALHEAVGDELGRRYEEMMAHTRENGAAEEDLPAGDRVPSTVTIGGITFPLTQAHAPSSSRSSTPASTPSAVADDSSQEGFGLLSEYPLGTSPPPEYLPEPEGTPPPSILASTLEDTRLWDDLETPNTELLEHDALCSPSPPPPFTLEGNEADEEANAEETVRLDADVSRVDDVDAIRITVDASLSAIGVPLRVPGAETMQTAAQGIISETEEPRAMGDTSHVEPSLRMFRVPSVDEAYVDPTFGDIWESELQSELARAREERSPEEMDWIYGTSAGESRTVEDPGPDYGEPIVTFGGEAELYSTFVDHRGNLYFKTSPVHHLHPLRLENRAAHDTAMSEAVLDFATNHGIDPDEVEDIYTWKPSPDDPESRTRHGFRDTSPQLFPGNVTHEHLASLDPDDDDTDALPGSRVRFMTQRIEHMANVNRPRSAPRVGIANQPTRLAKDIACLTAELEIGGTKAFMLFDSGSNTDSLTPEFARATNCRIFKLDEQVTLQLGCVGSRSRINYGARAPINFGSIKGHAYYDLVNLDRYDGIIGTLFMIKHGLVLDFGKREVRLPSGKVISTLSLSDEAKLVRDRDGAAPPPRHDTTLQSPNSLN